MNLTDGGMRTLTCHYIARSPRDSQITMVCIYVDSSPLAGDLSGAGCPDDGIVGFCSGSRARSHISSDNCYRKLRSGVKEHASGSIGWTTDAVVGRLSPSPRCAHW